MKGWEICQNKMKKQENWYSYVNGKCDFSAVRITGAVERYSSMIIGSTCQEDHQFSLYVYHNLGLNYIKQKLIDIKRNKHYHKHIGKLFMYSSHNRTRTQKH